jgi:hypothetical protein
MPSWVRSCRTSGPSCLCRIDWCRARFVGSDEAGPANARLEKLHGAHVCKVSPVDSDCEAHAYFENSYNNRPDVDCRENRHLLEKDDRLLKAAVSFRASGKDAPPLPCLTTFGVFTEEDQASESEDDSEDERHHHDEPEADPTLGEPGGLHPPLLDTAEGHDDFEEGTIT